MMCFQLYWKTFFLSSSSFCLLYFFLASITCWMQRHDTLWLQILLKKNIKVYKTAFVYRIEYIGRVWGKDNITNFIFCFWIFLRFSERLCIIRLRAHILAWMEYITSSVTFSRMSVYVKIANENKNNENCRQKFVSSGDVFSACEAFKNRKRK